MFVFVAFFEAVGVGHELMHVKGRPVPLGHSNLRNEWRGQELE